MIINYNDVTTDELFKKLPEAKTVLVCGGRDFDDQLFVDVVLCRIAPELIITGNASGADQNAEEFAKFNDIKVLTYPADWNKYGKSAGPIRNRQMLDENINIIDYVIAFPGGKGTKDMIKYAKEKLGEERIIQFI